MNTVWTLVSAFGGSLVGSAVSAFVGWRLAQRKEDSEAADALWAYQYALNAYANKCLAHNADGQVLIASSDMAGVEAAHREAYPYGNYLPSEARTQLIRNPVLKHPDDPGSPPDEVFDTIGASAAELAKRLEDILGARFSKRGAR